MHDETTSTDSRRSDGEARCGNCRYFRLFAGPLDIGGTVHEGACVIRSVPPVVPVTDQGLVFFKFPPRMLQDFCGEYARDLRTLTGGSDER